MENQEIKKNYSIPIKNNFWNVEELNRYIDLLQYFKIKKDLQDIDIKKVDKIDISIVLKKDGE